MILEILRNLFFLNCAIGLSIIGMPLVLAWHALIGVKAETMTIGFGKTILRFKFFYINVEWKAVPIMNMYLKHKEEAEAQAPAPAPAQEEMPGPTSIEEEVAQDFDDIDPFVRIKEMTPRKRVGAILYHLGMPVYMFLFSAVLVGFEVPTNALLAFPSILVGLVTEGPYALVWEPMGPLLDQGFLRFCGVVFAYLAAYHCIPFWGTSAHFIMKDLLAWVFPKNGIGIHWLFANATMGISFGLILLLLLGMFRIF